MSEFFMSGIVVARRGDTWPIGTSKYRGVCRGQWWPLCDRRIVDARARRLKQILDLASVSRADSSLAPDTSIDAEFLRSFVAVCDELEIGPLYSLVCSSLEPSAPMAAWVTSLKEECEYLGIDVAYASGSYSFVMDDSSVHDNLSVSRREISQFLEQTLNANGLFSSLENAEEFLRLHQKANDQGANLETLDGALVLQLWEDSDSSRLRRALGM